MKNITHFHNRAFSTTKRLDKSRTKSPRLSPGTYTALGFYAILPASLVLCITILMSSCSKNEGSGKSYNIIDKNFFFTVNINGKAYTSYGWYSSDHHPDGRPYSSGGPFIQSNYDIDPLSGDTIRKSWITVHSFVTNNIPSKPVGNCNASIGLTKKGSKLGTYTFVKSPIPENEFYNLDGKSYFIDQEGEQLIITKISSGTYPAYVEGTFTCNIWQVNGPTTAPIPATGSFRLKGN